VKNEVKVTSNTSPTKVLKSMPVVVTAETINQSLECGLRQDHVTCEHGGIASGAGVGSPWITMEWKGKYARIHAVDLLAAWVRTLRGGAEDAEQLMRSK
jgi:hypothetical protein